MKLSRHMNGTPVAPSMARSIPMMKHRFGSWEVAINRLPRAPEDLASQYDAASRHWSLTARRLHLETAYRTPLLVCRAVTDLADPKPNARVLDCGIGAGSLSIAMNSVLPDSIAFHGIDVSKQMLAKADIALRQAGMSPQLEQADILSIPHAGQSFDVVMAAHVLEHLPDPQSALTEMIRVLKPGGVVFICITRRSVLGAFIQLRWRTWTVTQQQGVTWLCDCQLTNIGFQPVRFGTCACHASTAFWAQKPVEKLAQPQIKTSAAQEEYAP